ncbi:MAG: PQQ-binding-like beta-propeller repeat protein [Coriobacteriia bacterium]|nr:PQQ-binding-like beta-propeller repeat protein [Coriobacteriia bacterium]MBN2848558.1 PQQ-binding-like beta-propeller repeat protein [Coriobacteriia bacterium]
MRARGSVLGAVCLIVMACCASPGCVPPESSAVAPVVRPRLESVLPTVTIEIPEPDGPNPDVDGIKIASFLGGETRRFYGIGPVPETLEVIWRTSIGSGTTGGTASSSGMVQWAGTGWTGQPALVREGGKLYLLVGGFDHNLVKIDAETGEELWSYTFDDVIKGSPTVFRMPDTGKLAVVCGSRRGFPRSIADASIAPVRCVDFETGEELWRLTAPRTRSYSRDADSSPVMIGDTLYVAIETGHVYAIDPAKTEERDGHRWPVIKAEQVLLGDSRASSHGGNLVLESSPSVIGDTIYLASGAGHVYGLDKDDLSVVWDHWIGSDLDGSPVTTSDGHILQAVEKQYIPGSGGVLKLDPRKPGEDAVVWFFPTANRTFADWQGGVIGSVAVNDSYGSDARRPALAAFTAIDGNLYVISQDETEGTVAGPQAQSGVPTPKLVFKQNVGGGISTPLMVDDYIIQGGYGATMNVFRIDYEAEGGVPLKDRSGNQWTVGVEKIASFAAGSFESTPIVWQGRIYVGSRDGSFYCLGDPDYASPEAPATP